MPPETKWRDIDDLETMLHNSLNIDSSKTSSNHQSTPSAYSSNASVNSSTLDPKAHYGYSDALQDVPLRSSSKLRHSERVLPIPPSNPAPPTNVNAHAYTSPQKNRPIQAVPAPEVHSTYPLVRRISHPNELSEADQRKQRLERIERLEAEHKIELEREQQRHYELAIQKAQLLKQQEAQRYSGLDESLLAEKEKSKAWQDLDRSALKPQTTAPLERQRAPITEHRRASADLLRKPVPAPPAEPAPEVPHQPHNSSRSTSDSHEPRLVKKGVEDFEFKGELGTGSYSTVVAALDKQTLRQYAVKILDKAHIIKEQKVKYVEIEKRTLNRLGDHPGIIRLYFTFQDKYSLYFVLDYAPNGELLHLIKKIGTLNEECARYYACQLLDAIEYMHKKGVVHRDLKPENILLDYKMRIKITDFGTAKLLDADPHTGEYPQDTKANSFVGTAEYVTPELLIGKTQGKSADIWAWGCVLYQMIAAQPPFQGNTQYLTFQKVAKLQYSIPPGFPFLVRDLLKHVLVKSPQRWTIDMIKEHEFFEGQNWSRKFIWSNPPPKLEPYKATVHSMKPRALGQRPMRPEPSLVSAKLRANNGPKPAFVPTRDGLQPVKPATVHGMPVNLRKSTPTGQNVSGGATAANSALYKTQPSTSNAYKQSQNRIEALKRRMHEQRLRTTSNVSTAPSHVSTAHSVAPSVASTVAPSVAPSVMSTQTNMTANTVTTMKPRPTVQELMSTDDSDLPKLPLSRLESQWSSVLTSSHERILKFGQMEVYVSANLPAQVNEDKDGKSKSGKAAIYQDDSFLSKLLVSSRNRYKTVMVTTWGRLLIIGQDKKLLHEIPVGVPQVSVNDVLFLVNKKQVPRIIIQTYNKVYTLDEAGQIPSWMSAIDLSKRYYKQTIAEQERRAFNVAAAAASAVSGRK